MATEEKIMEKENSAESCNIQCTRCKHKGIHKKAEIFCHECKDHYCLSCVKVHEDVPSLFGHTIQNLQELQEEKSSTSLPAVLTERCAKHAYKLVDMYCLNHDTVCCVLCQDADHRSCKEIFSIPEYVRCNEPALLPEDFQAEIEPAITKMVECQTVYQHKKQYLLAEKDNLLENIAQFRQEINAKLDDLETKTVSEIDEKIRALTDELEIRIAKLKSDIAKMKSAEKSMETSCNNKYQMFVSSKIGLEVARKAKHIGHDDDDLGHMEAPDFKGDQRILSILGEMNDMGIVRQLKTQDTDATSPPENSCHLKTVVAVIKDETGETIYNRQSKRTVEEFKQQDKKVLQFQIKKKTTVCTKVDSDNKEITGQGITSCCFIKNGKIILGDYDNKKLKMLDRISYKVTNQFKMLDRSSYKVTNQFDLPGSPWQLCVFGDHSIAVSLGTMRKILLFSLQYHIQKSSSFSTDHNCYGLAYADSKFYISDSNTYIYVYSEFGIKLKQLTHNLLRSPNLINSLLDISLKSLAVNDDGSRIFVTHQTNGLIMLHNEGKDVKQYNEGQLQLAFGCHYLTGNKGLLVCGMDSNNVLLFGPDGEIIQQVLRWDGGHDYKLVCSNTERTKMVVCRAGTYYIDIFHVQKDT